MTPLPTLDRRLLVAARTHGHGPRRLIVHYPSDVLAGAALGSILGSLAGGGDVPCR